MPLQRPSQRLAAAISYLCLSLMLVAGCSQDWVAETDQTATSQAITEDHADSSARGSSAGNESGDSVVKNSDSTAASSDSSMPANPDQQETAESSNAALPKTITNSIGMKLALIPAGTFTMGDGSDAHKVTLTQPFLLGVHEVTQEQYARVMGSNPSKFKGPQNPVEQVSWEDAMEFCRKLSALPEERAAGRAYRLPTEAEWEYACRAGTTTKYGFGNDASDLGEYAWYSSNSGIQTHPVGQKQPNSWGLYDMHGNVWEWCADWYEYGYPSGSVTDPTGPQSGSYRVGRGGGWHSTADVCRSAARYGYNPWGRNDYRLGFRITCVPSGQ